MALHVASLNIRGLREANKRRELFWLLWKKPYNVIYLQETHSSKEIEQLWKNEWGGEIYYGHSDTNARGVAILVKNLDIKVHNIQRKNGRYIILDCLYNNCQYTLGNIYGPNTDDPSFVHDLFETIGLTQGTSLILGGDFKIVQDPVLDRKGARHTNDGNARMRAALKHYIDEFDLSDIWRCKNLRKKNYTWRNTSCRQSRLDYFLISQHLGAVVHKCEIEPGYKSDHSLVTISIEQNNIKQGPGFWKFNCSLLHDPEYVVVVKRTIEDCNAIYGEDGLDSLMYWEALKLHIRGETIKFSSQKKKKQDVELCRLEREIKQLEANESLNEEELNILDRLKIEYNTIIQHKARGAAMRAKVRYYEEGERNTKYFLGLEKRKKVIKQIRVLTNIEGNDISDQTEIRNMCKSFYEELYTTDKCFNSCDHETVAKFFTDNNKKLSDEESNSCEGELTQQELLAVLKTSKNGSSPGIDGFPVEFYKFFWEDISRYLVAAMGFASQTGLLSINQRRGIVSLIPKGDKNTKQLKNWRPITLLCCDYKLASKAIANRVKHVLESIIHHNQTGFLPNRFIGENITTTLELIEQLEKEDSPGVIFSVDFEKAFDNIDWDYIDSALQYYNFGPQLRNWVKLFYTNISSTINVNGWFTDFFSVTRGVRQGDPLSSYLFLLCVEPLAQAIRSDKDIVGIKRNELEHKLNQFADDTLIFTDGSLDSINSVLHCLNDFSKCSGLKINCENSIAYKIGSLIGSDRQYDLIEKYSGRPIQLRR